MPTYFSHDLKRIIILIKNQILRFMLKLVNHHTFWILFIKNGLQLSFEQEIRMLCQLTSSLFECLRCKFVWSYSSLKNFNLILREKLASNYIKSIWTLKCKIMNLMPMKKGLWIVNCNCTNKIMLWELFTSLRF